MRNADRITAVLLLAFSVAFGAGALKHYKWWGDEGPGSAFLPFWVSVVMGVLAVLMLVRSAGEKARGPAWLPRGRGRRDLLVVLAASVAYVALLKVIGLVLGTAIFLAGLARYLGRHRWWVCALVGAGAAGFIWLVFGQWLRLPLPAGPLGF